MSIFANARCTGKPLLVINAYDIAYGIGIGLSAPFWAIRPAARRKVARALGQRMGKGLPPRPAGSRTVLIHAVSLGEMNATRALVAALAEARPDLGFVITTTTQTGYDRGVALYGNDPRIAVIRYPLDFSSAIGRVLDAMRPSVAVLMELEVWPNFVLQCRRRSVPVILVNGRLTAGSFRNYRLGGPLVRRMFARLQAVCAQEQTYADRFVTLGAPPERVLVTGTMKFDTAQIAERIEGSEQLTRELGLRPGAEPILVCGSTGPGEEQILLGVYAELLKRRPTLRLVLVPRKPERFDQVADLIAQAGFEVLRRSRGSDLKAQVAGAGNPVVLGDTMGELRKFYSIANVVFVGRTLVDLGSRQHGSDMIEPAALARPVIVGPFTANFAEVMQHLRAAGAVHEVTGKDQLPQAIARTLEDPQAAAAMGRLAQDVVRRQQGATARNASTILQQIPS